MNWFQKKKIEKNTKKFPPNQRFPTGFVFSVLRHTAVNYLCIWHWLKYVHWSCCTLFCTCYVCEWDRRHDAAVEGNTCADLVTLLYYVCLHVYVMCMWVKQTTRRSSRGKYMHWSCYAVFARVCYVCMWMKQTTRRSSGGKYMHWSCYTMFARVCYVCMWVSQQDGAAEGNTCTDLVTLCLHVYVMRVCEWANKTEQRREIHALILLQCYTMFVRTSCMLCMGVRQTTRRSNP